MKAFWCHSDWCETSAIIFAETRGKAKWQFIQNHCDGEWKAVTCVREKRLDHYGAAHKIPFKELVWLGWWVECYQCGMHVDESHIEDAGMDVDNVQGFYTGVVYCSKECEHESHAEREAKEKLEARVIEEMIWKLEDRLPGAQIELVEPYTYLNGTRGLIYDARLNLIIDGYSVEYKTPTRTECTLDELKKTMCFLSIHQNDFPHFEERYGLEQK